MLIAANNRIRLLHHLIRLRQDKLNVARRGHEGIDLDITLAHEVAEWRLLAFPQGETYTTVGAVCPPALLRGLVHLDVLNDKIASIETLGIGV
jgi:hypothetical protein